MNTVSNPRCPHCKGVDLDFDGLLRWSIEKQEYVVVNVFDTVFCIDCGCEIDPEWSPYYEE